ncbi:MAG TPA: T9SS type A sorting domain-containing protein [Bacteroidia bacterium]|nr:T9SS type A sorting domain-containing protein [Bacteroidia bacterium]
MKKNLLTLTFSCATAVIWAQSAMVPVFQKSMNIAKIPDQNSIQSIDTLSQYFDRATSFVLYGVQTGGYIFGTGFFNGNMISDETACHFDGIGNATVTEVLLWCGSKEVIGTADNLAVNIYSVNTDTSANTLLGTAALTTNDLDTTNAFTSVLINAPITSSFLASFAYAGIDDTLGLVCSDPTMNDGAGEKRARYKLSTAFGGGWTSISDLYTGGIDADVMIIPIVDVASGVQQFEAKDFSLKPVYPSPASDNITLDYTLHGNVIPSFFIMDKSGRILQSEKLNGQQGKAVYSINISELAAGTYYLTFHAGATSLTQKFSVIK